MGGIETEISEKREVNMELNVKLDPMAYLPERAHPTDAGLDLRTPHDVLVMPGVGPWSTRGYISSCRPGR